MARACGSAQLLKIQLLLDAVLFDLTLFSSFFSFFFPVKFTTSLGVLYSGLIGSLVDVALLFTCFCLLLLLLC